MPRLGLAPQTVRIRVRRDCTPEDRVLTLEVRLDDFPIHTTERQLEGCHDPLTFTFLRELREPGAYTFIAAIAPTGARAVTSAELH
jgi:hypothetical protein